MELPRKLREKTEFAVLIVGALALLAGLSPLAQPFPAGSIQGAVSDTVGKPIAKALVTATNTNTGVQTRRQTNASGAYSISPIQPGPYNVEVVADGYQRLLQENVNVADNKVTGLSMKLTPGGAPVTVSVTNAPPTLDLAHSNIGGDSIANELYTTLPPADGTIQGKIIGPKGASIANALVTIVNTNTGTQNQTHADTWGTYSFHQLPYGPYIIEVAANGYVRLLQENIAVAPSVPVRLDFILTLPDPTAKAKIPYPTLDEKPGQNGASLGIPAAVPLFRDPAHDGAADPVVVWNRERETWWMLYTNRRADLDGRGGVEWVHGTHIGIAESADGGAHWKYVSEADIPLPAPDYTLWAPEVIDVDGTYHMFLTVVPGTFTDWNHPRHILHLTSKDLLHWKPLENANLESERTIDACVFKLPDGHWRLWYKNEADSSKVYFSDSPDLVHWTPKGIATTNHGEGPVVFQWHDAYWLINDPHSGLAAFRSDDLTNWKQQPDNLLRVPGTQPTDRAIGNHADVVVDGSGRAWLFYFTHQGGPDEEGHDPGWSRRSFLHVTELHEKDGILTVDRNAPAYIHMLPPPKNKKSDVATAW